MAKEQTSRIQVVMPRRSYEALKKAADARDVSPNFLAGKAIRKYLAELPPIEEVGQIDFMATSLGYPTPEPKDLDQARVEGAYRTADIQPPTSFPAEPEELTMAEAEAIDAADAAEAEDE